MAILEIQRYPSKKGRDELRAYKILIDGNKVDDIKSGETKRLELPEGEHLLQFKIDWCTSREVSLTLSEERATRAVCYPNEHGVLSILNFMLDTDNYIIVDIL